MPPHPSPVQQAGKVCVQPLIPANQLVAECQAWHQAALLQPEDGTEAAAEVNPLHTGKRQEPLCKAAAAAHPLQRPLCLLADDGYCVDGP